MLEGIIKQYSDKSFHYHKVSTIPIKDSVVVYGDTSDILDKAFIKRQLDNKNKVILLPEVKLNTEPPLLMFLIQQIPDILRNQNIIIIRNDLNQYGELLSYKSPTTLFFTLNSLKFVNKKVILLMRDKKRVKHVQKHLLNTLRNITVFQAIDAQTPGALDDALSESHVRVASELKAGEVGCMCSHMKLWRELLDTSKDPCWMIMEDDVIPIDSFTPDFKNILDELPNTFDFIYFYISPDHYRNDLGVHLKNKKYINQPYENYNTCAYLISRKGAKKLLNKLKVVWKSLEDIVWKEIESGYLEGYCSKKLLFKNIGLKAVATLESNINNSSVYHPVSE